MATQEQKDCLQNSLKCSKSSLNFQKISVWHPQTLFIWGLSFAPDSGMDRIEEGGEEVRKEEESRREGKEEKVEGKDEELPSQQWGLEAMV